MIGGQIGNVDLVKQINGAAVYRLIDQQGPISRIQVAEVSQLAPASVTKITRQLLEKGLIKEVAQQASTGGRRAISLTTEVNPFHSICISVGRDSIHTSLIDLGGEVLVQKDQSFSYRDQEQLKSQLISHIRLFIGQQQSKIEQLVAIGITVPGLVDPEQGVIHYMPNTDIANYPIGSLISDEFNLPCYIGNEVRGMALAEHYFGSTKDCLDSIFIRVHNGTGSGIIVGGQVFLGSNRNVGEIGHIQVDPLGEQCQCGNFGCLETIASNPAILKRIQARISQGYASSLSTLSPMTIEDVCQHALQGDELARQSLVQVGDQLGKAVAIMINLFNPQKVVLAGEITEAKELLFPAIARNVQSQSLSSFNQGLPIEASALSDKHTYAAFAIIKRAMLNGSLLQKILED
ncbi:DNA-binding transcriptional regulator NagC [Vibrio ulleungensis]|uniref:ROK family protein n=1 Tax=Vibrio ulleungensis TaxID=2807619 RepID=A0ABS2HK82_9VIBR|nr:ROK family protein [Vibrio ulleungensis]MBM7036512.1 ROK family protein [Vibrio ulleungensis]